MTVALHTLRAWVRHAEEDAAALRERAGEREADAERLRECAALWSRIREEGKEVPIKALTLLSPTTVAALKRAGIETVAALTEFWFSSSAVERGALRGMGGRGHHLVNLALRRRFNLLAPDHLRDPPHARRNGVVG